LQGSNARRFVALGLAASIASSSVAALADAPPPTPPSEAPATPLRLKRREVPISPSSEYYSTESDAGVLVRVNIWGEVSKPGVHFLPEGTTIFQAISSAGGPLASADKGDIELLRGVETASLDVHGLQVHQRLRENDTIFVDRSIRSDVPLILQSITVLVSLATLYRVYQTERK
jgi:hypothetical protein